MIIDASALVTIIREEPGFQTYLNLLLESPVNRTSAATILEAAIVVDRLPIARAAARFDDLVDRLDIVIEPVTAHQARIARGRPAIWPWQRSPGKAQLRRLLCLRAGQGS